MRLLRLKLAVFSLIYGIAVMAGDGGHLLRGGDVLAIKVFNHSELDLSARIQQDGTIRVPLCGKVKAAGIDAGTLATDLSVRLKAANIEEAFVTVFVTSFAPRTVYIIGEVKEGGMQLEIPAQGRITLMQAISSAGGFSDHANKAEIGVLRMTKAGKQARLSFNAATVMNGVAGAEDLVLQPEDTVLILPASPVSVFGLVGTPGIFPIDTARTVTCSDILCRAGGLKIDADLTRVLLMRHGDDDKPTVESVDVDAVLNGDLTKNITVKPGDVMVVNAKDQVFILGEVKSPGAISLDRKIPLTIAKAVAQVGGTTRNANRRDVLIFRQNKTIAVNLKAILTEDRDEPDQPLQPGDVIYVPESMW